MYSIPICRTAVRLAAVALLSSSVRLAHAAPAAVEARALYGRAISFAESCTDIAYFGYCRVEATCTLDGSAISTDAETQHTILDLGQCIGYNKSTEQLTWRSKSVSRWNMGYCAPCSQCTIDPDTTEMTCDCSYVLQSKDHTSQLLLSDHVYNHEGLLSCLDVIGDPDPNYSMKTTTASTE
ncbi:hypothetical protein CMQ_291 [Grosmannia clavigera kw1407]|uniref:Cyanovirin-N domain-containing protein n=1 Tax=Grosmannia clavigera (strain kw1407 / UAMH 11150) TaxID=655863 RepID=F0XQQ1_GROCL|nr:uncharacterized protein CMQ_291 [Grosmannia clavigera kw1407]EFW99973.1 hypothetical protein CMQ_291 [Grosmannia clavigera kw1407]